jgi:phage anti-repressor protein
MNDYIITALKLNDLLTIEEFIRITAYPIDAFMIDKFWNTLEEGQLIYVDDELISWMGYSSLTQKERKKHFVESISKYFDEKEYYIYDNKKYSLFLEAGKTASKFYPQIKTGRGYATTKHLLLTSDCLKTMMMSINTNKAKQIRRYYLELEKVFKLYSNYQSQLREREREQQLLESKKLIEEKDKFISEKEQQLAIFKKRDERISFLIENVRTFKDKEYVYISTSDYYSSHNQFKIGITSNLKSRLSSYNTGHAIGDMMYYCFIRKCFNSSIVEKRLTHLLSNFQSKKQKEFYILHYSLLEKIVSMICDEDNQDYEIVNNIITSEYQGLMLTEPVKIKPILEYDGIIFTYKNKFSPDQKLLTLPAANNKNSKYDNISITFKNKTYAIKKEEFPSNINITFDEFTPILLDILQLNKKEILRKDFNSKIRTKYKKYKENKSYGSFKTLLNKFGITLKYR